MQERKNIETLCHLLDHNSDSNCMEWMKRAVKHCGRQLMLGPESTHHPKAKGVFNFWHNIRKAFSIEATTTTTPTTTPTMTTTETAISSNKIELMTRAAANPDSLSIDECGSLFKNIAEDYLRKWPYFSYIENMTILTLFYGIILAISLAAVIYCLAAAKVSSDTTHHQNHEYEYVADRILFFGEPEMEQESTTALAAEQQQQQLERKIRRKFPQHTCKLHNLYAPPPPPPPTPRQFEAASISTTQQASSVQDFPLVTSPVPQKKNFVAVKVNRASETTSSSMYSDEGETGTIGTTTGMWASEESNAMGIIGNNTSPPTTTPGGGAAFGEASSKLEHVLNFIEDCAKKMRVGIVIDDDKLASSYTILPIQSEQEAATTRGSSSSTEI